jgi:hypothetical protein
MPIEEHVQLAKHEIVDAKYSLTELMDLAWDNPYGFRLNEEPMERNDVDDQPTPIVKFPQAYEYAQFFIKFCNKTSFGVFNYRCHEHAIS